MKRILPILMVGMLGACTAAAQSSASAQTGTSTQSQTSVQASRSGVQTSGSGSASASGSANAGKNSANSSSTGNGSLSGGTRIDTTLTKSLDAKKSKPGDRVEARTTQDVKQGGNVVLKKGTHLVGHVTDAQARTKGQTESQLGIVFDHAVLSSGQEMPFNATIQALAAAESSTGASAGPDDMMVSPSAMGTASGTARSGGGLVGGVASTAGGAAGSMVNTAGSVPVSGGGSAGGALSAVTHSTGAVGGLTSSGRLASNSSGVFGLQGLSVNSVASGATQGSMIVSSTKNVHLDSGTQMLLSVTGQAQ